MVAVVGNLSRLRASLSSFESIQILGSPGGFVAIPTLLTQSVGASIGAIMPNFVSFSSSCLSLDLSTKDTHLEGDIFGDIPGSTSNR